MGGDGGDGVEVLGDELGLDLIDAAGRMRIVGRLVELPPGRVLSRISSRPMAFRSSDADLVARDVLKKGTGGWRKLGQIVFSNPEKRQLLNRLLAPYISSGIFYEILKLWMKGFKVIVLDVPLLFEAKMDKWTKPIIVVWVDPETQLQRLMLRDTTNEDDARNRINAQMSLDLKRTKADIVVANTGSLEDLKEKFQSVLFEVTKPLTWTEFWLSRQGASSALVSIIVGVLMFRKVYISDSKL
ncbi:hypothetical protein M0R45_011137 [Rubus argutus]|uniref:Dephospho-CoA kinase n=1 Tax=Rubus argutus TaxID=59490 RepID=A0AAW1YCU5_RUBAR